MAYKHGKRKRDWRPLYVLLALVLVFVVVLVAKHHNRSPLPKAIDRQVSFVVFFPDSSWRVKPDDIAYDTTAKVLNIQAVQKGITLTINQQAAPSQFNDIPQYYPTLLNKLNQFDSFGTINGTVNLVKPTEVNTIPQAVLYANGTLLFVRPSKTLNNATWRQFFSNLRVLK